MIHCSYVHPHWLHGLVHRSCHYVSAAPLVCMKGRSHFSFWEPAWRARLWPVFPAPRSPESEIIAETTLGRELDALGATRLDLYG